MTDAGTYQRAYGDGTPYQRAVRLIEAAQRAPGVVLDLGAGYGAPAEPLRERGHTYVACDTDPHGLADLRERAFETHVVDLEADTLADRLGEVAAGRAIAAILMLDSLEHLRRWDIALDAVTAVARRFGNPLLVTSIPNVAHLDLGAKLLFGRWDVTPTGLLDHTHLSFFTADRIAEAFGDRGWSEVGRDDLSLRRSDQHFPPSHPALREGAPVHEHLRHLRSQVDPHGDVNQFVRAYALTEAPTTQDDPGSEDGDLFASVLVRTQGKRDDVLLEALTCLAAQTVDAFEVLLLVHSPREDVHIAAQALVDLFHPTFRDRVRVLPVLGGGRAAPLNRGLQVAHGRYVTFLDDDDLVTADWIESFLGGEADAPGAVLRAITVDQKIVRSVKGARAPYVAISGFIATHAARFDMVQHLYMNQTPICSVAYPKEQLDLLGLRFDEHLEVLEDWQLLMELAFVCGVHDIDRITSIYHRWEGTESSWGAIDPRIWDGVRLSILRRFDARPLLLPKGSATRIALLQEDLARLDPARFGGLGASRRQRLLKIAFRLSPNWLIRLRRQVRARKTSVLASR